jgi:KaiC/GvpD/RAD55 family RecA-like ATPase
MSADKTTIERLATGVPGLDDILGGGLPEFSFNVIAGPPGCGKTTLAHQIMFALASPQRSALYFTVLGETALKMLRYQQQFEFFDGAQVNRTIRFVNLAEEAAAGDLKKVLARMVAEVQAQGPGLVFVDSFRSVAVAAQLGTRDGMDLQEFVQQLGVMMASWQATTEDFRESLSRMVMALAGTGATILMTSELEDRYGDLRFSPYGTAFLTDAIIVQRYVEIDSRLERVLAVAKVRNSDHSNELRAYRIDEQGIQIGEPIANYEGLLGGRPALRLPLPGEGMPPGQWRGARRGD